MSCPVTLDEYNETNFPVSLPCGHTISILAANSIKESSESVYIDGERFIKFTCPICRDIHMIKPSHTFSKNYALLAILENQTGSLSGDASIEADQTLPVQRQPYTIEVSPMEEGQLVKVSDITEDESVQNQNRTKHIYIGCDISGSMGKLVNKNLGLTRLDLVKYNVEMLLRYLAEKNDPDIVCKITIVAFSNIVRVLFERTAVTYSNLSNLINTVSAMRHGYATNIKAAMNTIFDMIDPSDNNIVAILTDGQPTDIDGYVEIDDSTDYIEILKQNEDKFTSLSMIGYGYSLANNIMLETARYGGGVSSFGSDETMISNVFIRWVAWAMTAISKPFPRLNLSDLWNTSSICINMPVLTKLQSQYCLIPNTHNLINEHTVVPLVGHSPEYDRIRFCKALEKSINARHMTAINDLFSSTEFKDNNKILANECLSETGEIKMAFSSKYFHTWGKAYLYSTLRGHEMSHMWNFKDKSLKKYSNILFDTEVSILDDIFAMMPAPTPSKLASESLQSYGGMSQVFNNQNSTCWTVDSMITLSDGSDCVIQDIRPGMKVTTFDPINQEWNVAEVKYVIRQACKNGTVDAVPLGHRGRARMTVNHPILDLTTSPNPNYCWAKNYYTPEKYYSDYVYNMVISAHHHILSDGVICVTMGHSMTEEVVDELGFTGSDVVPHSYFGDMSKVTSDIQKIGVDNEEYVTVNYDQVIRDPYTGYITSLSGC